jgi:diguanylate cyclase (GGDEF)-like protein
VSDEKGKPTRMAGSLTDVTDRKVAEERLLHNAFYDGLTELPNRSLFMDRLGRSLARAKRREDYMFAVLFLDLDRFKNVNDSLGHTVGDELLISVARRLETCLRPGDTAARLGGDEFTMLLDDITDVSDATRVAERIQQDLAIPFDLNGHEVFVAASIGIAVSAIKGTVSAYDLPEDVLRDADTAMYRAKALGKARHEVFDEAMHARALALLRMETDLRRALERENFRVYYQPLVSLETGRISGFEALVRWEHPERGLVSPAEFISLAEETGLIIAIDRWVLREACHQTRLWQEKFGASTGHPRAPLYISANLSSKQFGQPDLVDQIEEIVLHTGLGMHSLKLEITESVLMNNAEAAAAMLLQLRKLGIRLSIDDFGTGYSSLSYLHSFPLDTLKIDRSFINRLGGDGEGSEIVRTIMTLSRNLGMEVVAEGVETAEQLNELRKLTCDYGQGYFFARPLRAEDAEALLERNPQW